MTQHLKVTEFNMDSCTVLKSIDLISSESSEICLHQLACDSFIPPCSSGSLSGLKPVSVQIIRGSMSPTYYDYSLKGPSSCKNEKEKAQKAKLAAFAQKQAECESSSSYSSHGCLNLEAGVDKRMSSPKDQMSIPSLTPNPIPSLSMLHAESSTPAAIKIEAKQAAANCKCDEHIYCEVSEKVSVSDKEKAKQAKIAAKKLIQSAGDCTQDNAGTGLLIDKDVPMLSSILDVVPSRVEVSTQTEPPPSVEESSQLTSPDDSNPESRSVILSFSERSSCPSDADLAPSSEGTESDYTSSTDQMITIFKCRPQYRSKKFLLMLVSFLSLISPCQQPVDAMRPFMTAMIIHPQYGHHNHITALLPLPSTETALIQHPKFDEKAKTSTALILIQPKITSVIIHPRFSLSSYRELAVVPPRSLQKCAPTLMQGNHTPDLKDLLQIIRLHRLASNFDYRHCQLSDNLQCSSLDQAQLYHQEFAVCPVKSNHTHTKVDHIFTDTLITDAVFKENSSFTVQFDVAVLGLCLLLSIIFTILAGESYNGTDNLDKHNDVYSEKRNSTNKYDAQSQTCSNGNVPMITVAATSFQIHQSVVPSRSDSLFNSSSQSINALCGVAAANSISTDSGFSSMHQNLSSNELAISDLNLTQSSIEFNPGELYTELDHGSQNLLKDQYDDEVDILEDMANEASLLCFASEQPMTSYFSDQPPQNGEKPGEYCTCTPTMQLGTPDSLELVHDISACDYDSNPDFTVAVAEEGAQIASLPSLNDPMVVLVQADGPISAVREPLSSDSTDSVPNQSVENQPQPIQMPPIPRPNIYTNTPASHHELQENTISFQVEGNHDPQLQGASVTVEPSALKDLCSLVPPPKPPDINKDLKPFAHHFETTYLPLTTMFDGHHVRPIRESTTQPLQNSELAGTVDITITGSQLPSRSMLLVPALHPTSYINGVAM